MADNDHAVFADQGRRGKSKRRQALCQLLDMPLVVIAWIARVGIQFVDIAVNDPEGRGVA